MRLGKSLKEYQTRVTHFFPTELQCEHPLVVPCIITSFMLAISVCIHHKAFTKLHDNIWNNWPGDKVWISILISFLSIVLMCSYKCQPPCTIWMTKSTCFLKSTDELQNNPWVFIYDHLQLTSAYSRLRLQIWFWPKHSPWSETHTMRNVGRDCGGGRAGCRHDAEAKI